MKKAKDVQAKANLAVKKQEGILKTAEKALDDKVCYPAESVRMDTSTDCLFYPIETRLAHYRDPDRTR